MEIRFSRTVMIFGRLVVVIHVIPCLQVIEIFGWKAVMLSFEPSSREENANLGINEALKQL